MPRRKPHRAVILVGGPEDGYVEVAASTLDTYTVITRIDGRPVHEYTYARTNRFEAKKRVFELVSVLSVRPRSKRKT